MIIETATLISVSTWLGGKIVDRGLDDLHEKIKQKSFNERFYQKVKEAAKKLQKDHPDALGGNIEYLFKHDDVFQETIKLLFFDAKIDLEIIKDKFDSNTLPHTFLLDFFEYLRMELYKDSQFREILENRSLYITVVGINNEIKKITQYSNLSLQELNEIKKTLQNKLNKSFVVEEFVQKYKGCILNNYSQINFIGLGLDLTIKKGKRKKLEELFVKPTFSIEDNDKEKFVKSNSLEKANSIDLDQIFNFGQTLVILGDPGSGKSILTKYIALKIVQKDEKAFLSKSILHTIPFRIELRNYHSFKKEHSGGISKYLAYMLELDFGFSNISHGDVIEILEQQSCLMLFDGLDEIFDIEDKLKIRSDIDNFITHYDLVKAIVTSRLIGYRDAALKDETTLNLTINKFNDHQIETYIRNWYAIEEEDADHREKETEDLLEKRTLINREIISNPLLLSLIVILYRNNLKVPESKLEIYESCTKTLVDKWDFSKNLKISLPEEIYKRKDTIFADLAFWQYKELSTKKGKVTFLKAKRTVAKTLEDKLKIVDEFTADLYAEQFLEYAEKRSLYFENNFTHKTFLEYFTAFWIFSNIEKKHKKNERNKLIQKYIESSYWHIVLELLMNLIDKDQADNEIIDELINFQLIKNVKSSQFFLQIYPNIKNVSVQVYESIIKQCINNSIKFYNDNFNKKSYKYFKDRNYPLTILAKHYLDTEYRKSIDKVIINYINTDLNIHYLLSFYLELLRESDISTTYPADNVDRGIIDVFDLTLLREDHLNYILYKYRYNWTDFESDPIKFSEDFIELFGKNRFLDVIHFRFSNNEFVPLGFLTLRVCLYSMDPNHLLQYKKLIESQKIDLNDIVSNIIELPIFVIYHEDRLENLFKNFSQINDSYFFIILVAVTYAIRYNRNYFDIDHDKSTISDYFKYIENLELLNHLRYVNDKSNHDQDINLYLINNFGIDEKLFKS